MDTTQTLKELIGLSSYPVGVKFYFDGTEEIPDDAVHVRNHRYCQALMRARRGEHVVLDGEGISCPAAAAAFGFKDLPAGLKSGKGLTGFGITKETETGAEMFRGMTTLEANTLKELYLFPLEDSAISPDVVVVEDTAENLMWIALAYVNLTGGRRIESSTAVLQATCVDATLIPYQQQKLNLSYGCYGCRDATDIHSGEAVLGFPYKDIRKVKEHIAALSEKAMPNSREKNAYTMLKSAKAKELLRKDIFQNHSE